MAKVYVGNCSWNTTSEDLFGAFSSTGCLNAEVVFGRDGRSRGYGIVEYSSENDANMAISSMNNTEIDGRQIFVRLDRGKPERKSNPAGGRSAGGRGGRRGGGAEEEELVESDSVFVGNLPWTATDSDVEAIFNGQSTVSVQVMKRKDGKSRGFAIARFHSVEDAAAAIASLNEVEMDGRVLSIRMEKSRHQASAENFTGTSVYVGNLSFDSDDNALMAAFAALSPNSATVALGYNGRSRGWGTIKFDSAAAAEQAIAEMDGQEIDGRAVHLRIDRRA